MSQIIEIAKMYNIITAKLKHTPLPVSLREFSQMVELAQEQPVRIRDCLKQLHKKGMVRKVPISNNIDMRERVGYEWVGRTPQSDAKIIQALITPKPIVKTEDDIRIKVNSDHSVTIITKAIRITIEVPT
jgi:hypothetical protein